MPADQVLPEHLGKTAPADGDFESGLLFERLVLSVEDKGGETLRECIRVRERVEAGRRSLFARGGWFGRLYGSTMTEGRVSLVPEDGLPRLAHDGMPLTMAGGVSLALFGYRGSIFGGGRREEGKEESDNGQGLSPSLSSSFPFFPPAKFADIATTLHISRQSDV